MLSTMNNAVFEKALWRKAMDLLARREHSRHEIREKLKRYDDSEVIGAVIEKILDKLETEHLLSEERFTEALIRNYAGKGYGPLYIRQKLVQQNVSADVISRMFDEYEINWLELAKIQRIKHFGAGMPEDKKQIIKQMRYLQQRGFFSDHISNVFR